MRASWPMDLLPVVSSPLQRTVRLICLIISGRRAYNPISCQPYSNHRTLSDPTHMHSATTQSCYPLFPARFISNFGCSVGQPLRCRVVNRASDLDCTLLFLTTHTSLALNARLAQRPCSTLYLYVCAPRASSSDHCPVATIQLAPWSEPHRRVLNTDDCLLFPTLRLNLASYTSSDNART